MHQLFLLENGNHPIKIIFPAKVELKNNTKNKINNINCNWSKYKIKNP